MKHTKKEIEEKLYALLNDMLKDSNQKDSIISLEYNKRTNECTVQLTVNTNEEAEYVGFGEY